MGTLSQSRGDFALPTLARVASHYLLVRKGAGEGALHHLTGPLTLGRGTAADVMIPDEAVSRVHASVRVDGDTVVVEDLESSNGTRVNGRDVSQARLEHGDVIELGGTELEVRIDDSDGGPSTPTDPTLIQPRPS
jgi:pSer/pThr/pTyr-binding forkhead associated (FHA) protein